MNYLSLFGERVCRKPGQMRSSFSRICVVFMLCFQSLSAQEITVDSDTLFFPQPSVVKSFTIFNTGSQALIIDRIITDSNFFGYSFQITTSDSIFFYSIIDSAYSEPFFLNISPNDTARFAIINLDICPICKVSQLGGTYEDHLFLLNNSLNNDSLDIFLYGDFIAPAAIDPENPIAPKQIEVYPNYPNPFNPLTNIRFSLPNAGVVRVKIFDQTGREVKLLVNGVLSPGFHNFQWDGTNQAGNPVSSGVYFYQVKSTAGEKTAKMHLVR